MFVADTVHTIFTLVYMYDSLIKNFGEDTRRFTVTMFTGCHIGNVVYLQTADWIFATGLSMILPVSRSSSHPSPFRSSADRRSRSSPSYYEPHDSQGIIGGTVQTFFAWRVKVLTHNVFLSLTILFCSVASLCTSLSPPGPSHVLEICAYSHGSCHGRSYLLRSRIYRVSEVQDRCHSL